jgi:hypothetical protein
MASNDRHVCDDCGLVFEQTQKIDFAYSTTTYADGNKEILTEPQEASPCCDAGFETFND